MISICYIEGKRVDMAHAALETSDMRRTGVCRIARRMASSGVEAAQSHMSLLTTTWGKAFDPVYCGAWVADAIFEA